MNRKEAIKYGTEWLKDEYLDAKDRAFIKIALETLEQEPILDKITEIIEPLRHLSIDEMSGIEWQILQVLDKYKAQKGEV